MNFAPHDRRRSLPPGGSCTQRRLSDGWPVRVLRWPAADATRGAILFAAGRADFVEKYAETLWHWVAAGIGVMAFDWRGQGGSGRLGADTHRGHCAGFDRWVADLDEIICWFVSELPGPYRLVAHSMGAHLALRHLAHARSPIARAALLAPMLGIRTHPLTAATVRRLAEWMVRIGQGGRYALLQQPYGAAQRRPARAARLTGDAGRFADEHWWLDAQPDWALGGVTWGWLASAFRSLDLLTAPGALEAVSTPVLVLIGSEERLVDVAGVARAARRLPSAVLETVPGARHELLRETDSIRTHVLARIDDFLGVAEWR